MRTATRTGSECFSMALGLLLLKPYDSLCVKTTISPQKGCSSNRKTNLTPSTQKKRAFLFAEEVARPVTATAITGFAIDDDLLRVETVIGSGRSTEPSTYCFLRTEKVL